jgi:5-formyltetrahydrofolate cyclo-ligase
MNVQEHKKLLRRQMETKRSAILPADRLALSAAICRYALDSVLQPFFAPILSKYTDEQAPPVLFTYIPVRAEVDISPILDWCWKQGIAVAAPRVESAGRLMTLHCIQGFEDVEEGAYGIREPKRGVPMLARLDRVQVMLVPGLAFDAQMGRLGYGGGYYDRFMRGCREQSDREPLKLALAYDMQLIPSVPMAPHDFQVDAIVTESRIIHKML